MKQKSAYTEEAAQAAKNLIADGWTNKEIRSVKMCSEIPDETLRTWKKRMKQGAEPSNETPETLKKEAVNKEQENAPKDAENAVSPVSDPVHSVSLLRFIRSHFSLMHLVFYATTLTGCYAIYDTLPNVIGIALLTVFALFSLDSVLKAQDSARPQIAEYGRNRVVASELVAAVFHYTILNKYLWANKAMLPFEIKLLPPEGGNFVIDFRGQILNGVWHNGEAIFYISIIISFLLFSAAFAAVDSVLRENKV